MTAFEVVKFALPYLLKGLGVTVLVAVCAMFFGIIIGLFVSLVRLLNIRVLKPIIALYISFIRGTPFLMQVFLVFYVLSALKLNLSAFATGVLALSLNTGAFLSEIIRSGLSTIPQGHIEAGKALGMKRMMILRRIVFPQVFMIVSPQLISEFITDIKSTPVLSIIALVEMTRAGQVVIMRTFQPIPIYIMLAILYFTINVLLERVVKLVELKGARKKG